MYRGSFKLSFEGILLERRVSVVSRLFRKRILGFRLHDVQVKVGDVSVYIRLINHNKYVCRKFMDYQSQILKVVIKITV